MSDDWGDYVYGQYQKWSYTQLKDAYILAGRQALHDQNLLAVSVTAVLKDEFSKHKTHGDSSKKHHNQINPISISEKENIWKRPDMLCTIQLPNTTDPQYQHTGHHSVFVNHLKYDEKGEADLMNIWNTISNKRAFNTQQPAYANEYKFIPLQKERRHYRDSETNKYAWLMQSSEEEACVPDFIVDKLDITVKTKLVGGGKNGVECCAFYFDGDLQSQAETKLEGWDPLVVHLPGDNPNIFALRWSTVLRRMGSIFAGRSGKGRNDLVASFTTAFMSLKKDSNSSLKAYFVLYTKDNYVTVACSYKLTTNCLNSTQRYQQNHSKRVQEYMAQRERNRLVAEQMWENKLLDLEDMLEEKIQNLWEKKTEHDESRLEALLESRLEALLERRIEELEALLERRIEEFRKPNKKIDKNHQAGNSKPSAKQKRHTQEWGNDDVWRDDEANHVPEHTIQQGTGEEIKSETNHATNATNHSPNHSHANGVKSSVTHGATNATNHSSNHSDANGVNHSVTHGATNDAKHPPNHSDAHGVNHSVTHGATNDAKHPPNHSDTRKAWRPKELLEKLKAENPHHEDGGSTADTHGERADEAPWQQVNRKKAKSNSAYGIGAEGSMDALLKGAYRGGVSGLLLGSQARELALEHHLKMASKCFSMLDDN